MRISVSILLITCLLVSVAACETFYENEPLASNAVQSNTTETLTETAKPLETETQPIEETTEPYESSINVELAEEYFSKALAIWDEDDGELWGIRLHAPLAFIDTIARYAAANVPINGFQESGGIYVGSLPHDFPKFIEATTATINGVEIGVMSWNDVRNMQGVETETLRTLIHEGFHAIQSQIVTGLHQSDELAHMYELEARVSVLLELNALRATISETGTARKAALLDALSIRYARREMYPESAVEENHFEINEGLALFTEYMLVVSDKAQMLDWISKIIDEYSGTANLRRFGYFSGVLYAMLLEELNIEWKTGITYNTDLGSLLRQHLEFSELLPLEQVDLTLYGNTETLVMREKAWVENYEMHTEGAREALIFNPTVSLFDEFYLEYEINEIEAFRLTTGLSHRFAIYGRLTVISENWRLELYDGYIELQSYPTTRISIGSVTPIHVNEDRSRAANTDWELIITNDGYMIQDLPYGLVSVGLRE